MNSLELRKTLNEREQRNVLVYGRRRVGKSELIKQALTDLSDHATVYYECRQTSKADNLEGLSGLVAKALGFPLLAFSSIREFIEFLFAQAKNKNVTLVLDEYPYLRDAVKGLDSILQTMGIPLSICLSCKKNPRSAGYVKNIRHSFTLDRRPM